MLGLSEALRSLLHRVAGVILIAAGIYHTAAVREGRKLLRDLAPGPRDAFDPIHTMLHHLGLRKERAEVRPPQLR